MGSWHRNLLVFLLVLVIGGTLVVFAATSLMASPHPILKYGLGTNLPGFGSSGLSTEGWLLPANTAVYTSYTSKISLRTFVDAFIVVFPYHVEPDTIVHLGLYVNGELEATQNYNVSSSNSPQAALISIDNAKIATFGNTSMIYPVDLSLSNPLPPDTRVSLVATFTNQVWIQIDPAAPVASYDFSSSSFPTQLPSFSPATQAPHTISVGIETNA